MLTLLRQKCVNMSKNQILQQAGTAVLKLKQTVKFLPQTVLSLLR